VVYHKVSVVGCRFLSNVEDVRRGFLQIPHHGFDGLSKYVFNVIDKYPNCNNGMVQFHCQGLALGLTTCIDIFKQAACLMYSQNPIAFEELVQNYDSIENNYYDGIMTQFYNDIFEFVNNHRQCYVLK
jgi:hypothetical protein